MVRKRSKAGGYAWRQHQKAILPWLAPMLLLVLIAPLPIFVISPSESVWTFLLVSAVLVLLMFVVDKITDGINATWGEGARGEFRVGEELDKLHKDGFHVFHDWYSGRGNVDHFVVGPQGVFAVETKAWEGEITCRNGELLKDGRPIWGGNPITQVRGEAHAVRKLIEEARDLSVWVQPVLCFSKAEVRCYGITEKVEVTDLGSLRHTILERPRRFQRSRVNSISYFLERKLGVAPSAKPGAPPAGPGRFKRLVKPEYVFVVLYATYWIALSLVFAGATADFFEGAADFYHLIESIWQYLF